jgi:hypothetical protein
MNYEDEIAERIRQRCLLEAERGRARAAARAALYHPVYPDAGAPPVVKRSVPKAKPQARAPAVAPVVKAVCKQPDLLQLLRRYLEQESARNLRLEPCSNVEDQKHWCAYCGRVLMPVSSPPLKRPKPATATRDHVEPLHPEPKQRRRRSRSDDLRQAQNVLWVCYECNHSKGNRLLIRWLLKHKLMRNSINSLSLMAVQRF